ncbi:MAG: Ig-like domain-containing protein [Melioribacteraceae bacterium]|nr:Ig-like domain-containing protein [Melioribacteraceae bacterium]
MAERTTFQKIILTLALVLFLYACANQLPPSGGDVDRIPPEIINIYPADQTINFDENYIEITFSEYVNKRSVQESIFISPNIDSRIEYDWSGKSVEIILPDTLLENTTYTITIGTEVEDINNRNRMEKAYTFAFSTGDKIDQGAITGTVLDAKPSGVMIYAYKVLTDTLNPIKQKPNYITQCGNDGSFRLTGLADGLYRVFAIRDEFKDFLYNPTQDQFGSPYKEINLSDSNALFTNLNFQLQKEDTTKPRVFNLTMTDQNHILIEFSEAIDSTQITNENFFIYDSTNQRKTDVDYFFKGRTKKNNFLIAFKDSLIESEGLYLVTQNIIDHQDNKLELEITSFVYNDATDTNHTEMHNFSFQYPNKKIDFKNSYVTFSYTDGFDKYLVNDAVRIYDKKNAEVEKQIKMIDDASFYVLFNELKPNSDYEIKIDQNKLIDAAGNKLDSVFTYRVSTINNLDFSGVSGKVIASDKTNIEVRLNNVADPKIQYSQNQRDFNFERVFPGKYLIIVFDDKNQNGEYDKGSVYPFEMSERFVFYPDTLDLKPRWPVGDIKINFEKN